MPSAGAADGNSSAVTVRAVEQGSSPRRPGTGGSTTINISSTPHMITVTAAASHPNHVLGRDTSFTMATPDELPPGLKARLDQIGATRSATTARLVRATQLHAHLVGSVPAATLFLATDLPGYVEIVFYLGAAAAALVGIWRRNRNHRPRARRGTPSPQGAEDVK